MGMRTKEDDNNESQPPLLQNELHPMQGQADGKATTRLLRWRTSEVDAFDYFTRGKKRGELILRLRFWSILMFMVVARHCRPFSSSMQDTAEHSIPLREC